MTQKRKKSALANTEAPHIQDLQQQQKKKSLISSGEEDIQMEVDQVIGIHFQEEIMMEILNRLPVRSLLRFNVFQNFGRH